MVCVPPRLMLVEMVEKSSAKDLDPPKAREVLGSLQKRLTEKPGRRLSIEWRIEETEGPR